jgi:acyl carrier protein phosphodiesterase
MNFLAHAYLSPPQPPGLLVGNLLADLVKGSARLALPPDIRAGFALHRDIDAFTDTHPIVIHCGELLAPRWGRYSTVLIDIFFDHCLAAHWPTYSPIPLATFVRRTYDAVRPFQSLLPERAQTGFHHMANDDWLTSYARLDGIALTLTRLSQRLRHDIDLAPAVEDFRTHAPAIHQDFATFFPQLQARCRAGIQACSQL